MTSRETTQLAVLTEQVKAIAKQLNANTKDTASIKSQLDNLTGGKQALMWITGLIMSGLIVISTWLGIHKK